jgi:hypothetical protein
MSNFTVNKFLGGKRINYSFKGSCEGSCAFVSNNTKGLFILNRLTKLICGEIFGRGRAKRKFKYHSVDSNYGGNVTNEINLPDITRVD